MQDVSKSESPFNSNINLNYIWRENGVKWDKTFWKPNDEYEHICISIN